MVIISTLTLYWADRLNPYIADNNGSANTSKIKFTRLVLYCLAFTIPLMVSALRYNIGFDWESYTRLFRLINSYGMETYMEFGFEALVRFVFIFSPSPQYIFAVSGFIVILLIFLAIKQNSVYPALSYFLFFALGHYFLSFGLVRNYIAVAICVWAYRYIKRDNMFMYVLFVLIASAFHRTALIMLLVCFIVRLRIKFSYYVIIIAAGVTIAILQDPLFEIVFSIAHFEAYRDTVYMEFHVSYFNLIMSLAVSAGCLAYYKQMTEDRGGLILANTAFIALIMYITMSGWTGWMLARIAIFLNIMQIFTIPKIISCERRPDIRVFYTVCIIIAFSVFCIIFIESGGDHLLPYQSIINVYWR